MIIDGDAGATRPRFAPGDVVVRREILLGEVWFAFPTICVEDSADLLALYIPSGTRFGSRPPVPFPPGVTPGWGTTNPGTGTES